MAEETKLLVHILRNGTYRTHMCPAFGGKILISNKLLILERIYIPTRILFYKYICNVYKQRLSGLGPGV